MQAPADQEKGQEPARDLLELELEQLAQQPVRVPGPVAAAAPLALEQLVTTVERRESTVGQSPSAVFVITPEMIRRSSATTLPDLFRMVPGMDVARINSPTWAVSARGFNDLFANKLLVQIDGRTIYGYFNAGVFWEAQDLLLQDIERIEVIRGPGATVWGANAVNGVINIVTKSARDTQGGLLTGAGGNEDRGFGGGRYGGKIGDNLYYRVYGKGFDRGPSFTAAGNPPDDWRDGRGGFRMDWYANDTDSFTLQGDAFDTHAGRQETNAKLAPPPPFSFTDIGDFHLTGENVLLRWRRDFDRDSGWALQFYYDRFTRSNPNVFAFDQDTFDLDFQQQFPLTERQQIVYGAGYRFMTIRDRGINAFVAKLEPAEPTNNVTSAFVQDEIKVVDERLALFLGSKFEHNDFNGFLTQPSGRLLWTPSSWQSAWAAVSRALRTTPFSTQNFQFTVRPPNPNVPVFPRIVPTSVKPEDVLAYEVGYRAQPTDNFSWDIAGFINKYDNLVAGGPGTRTGGPLPAPIFIEIPRVNGMEAESYGVELAANIQLTEDWRLYGAYTLLEVYVHRGLGVAAESERLEGQSPNNQLYLQSSWNLSRRLEFDLIGRYVDQLPAFSPPINSYLSLDARLGWRPRNNLELAVVGQNLLQNEHAEFGGNPFVGVPVFEIQRSVYGMLTCRW